MPQSGSVGAAAGAKLLLLDVEAVLHVRGAVSEHTEARAGIGREHTRPEVRVDAGFVLEREEHVVVRDGALAPRVDLRVELAHRPEELHGLVDEVAAQVEEKAAAFRRRRAFAPAVACLRAPALEARLEPVDASKLPGVQQLPHRQEVPVPAPVLERGHHQAPLGGRVDERASLLRVQRERLVDDDGQPRLERGQPEREMALVRRRDHGQIELGRSLPDLIRGPDDLNSSVLPERLVAALFVTGHDHRQPEARRRRDERRVEDGAREAVAEECHVRSHSWNAPRRSASSSSSSRTEFDNRPNESILTPPFS